MKSFGMIWLKKKWIHLVIWLIFILYEILMVVLIHGIFGNPLTYLLHYTINISFFYLQSDFVLPWALNKPGLIWWKIPFSLCCLLPTYIGFHFLADQLLISTGVIEYSGVYKIDSIFIYKNLFRGIYFLLFSIGYYLFKIREIDRVEKEQLKQMKLQLLIQQQQTNQELAEMQNAYLKAQINPHFLFNTLDFVYHSIYSNPEIASDAIIHLAKVMRFAIDSNLDSNFIKLGDEISHTQNLLSLYAMRKPNLMMPEVEYQDSVRDIDFIPLVILTLAENMIKHGIFSEKSSPSYIRIYTCNEFLTIQTRNPCQIKKLKASTGNGILNVKKRLRFTYGASTQLFQEIDNNANFRVTIRIPLSELLFPC